jgi:CelD/BcsL family acetyltransferase involved in cellulose biosynthesis
MPGTWHERPAAVRTQVITVRGWPALRSHEAALEALHRDAGTPVTARLAWWQAAVRADPGAEPVLLAVPAAGGTLRAAALVAWRGTNGDRQITSVRPHTDDVWEVAAASDTARRAVLTELALLAGGLSRPWELVLTGLRDGDEAAWLAGQLPTGRAVFAPPVPGIGFTRDEVTYPHGIRRGLDRSGHRIRQQGVDETIRFEREPARLAALRDEIEAVHRARDRDAGRLSDLDDDAGTAFWRSVYDLHAGRGELEVATLRLDGHLAAYVIALTDGPAYRVFDGRFAPAWRQYSPGRRLEAAVVDHARRWPYRELDWMSSVAPEKLVASTREEPRWTVVAGDAQPVLTVAGEAPSVLSPAADPGPAFTAAGGSGIPSMTAAAP